MGVTGRITSISDHKKRVITKLQSYLRDKGRKAIVAEACLALMNTPSGGSINVDNLNATEMGYIKNYFAEVMGPIWSQEYKLIPGLRASDRTFFSTSDTETLYDFKVFRNSEEILVSNKQKKGGTNTLKPGDVIRLVNDNQALRRKWRNTKYYTVFEILKNANVVSGPIRAVSECYPKELAITKADYTKIINQLTQNDVVLKDVPESIMRMVRNDEAAFAHYKKKRAVTGTMINFLFEKVLINISAKDENYHNLFVDVTNGNVLFLKFDLSNRGKVYFGIERPQDSPKKAKLRSKQGVERRSSKGLLKLDKLGFQP